MIEIFFILKNFLFQVFIYNKNEKFNINNKRELLCPRLKDTRYNHQLHSLIYSELYNTIFVLSGRVQTGCEYGILNEKKNSIKEWKEFTHIRNPRQNALSFLLNEKYLFLIGGQNINTINYDVFDISSIFDKNIPRFWKTYNLKYNKLNKEILNSQNAGIINNGNEIFILGGHRNGFKKAINLKICFTNDERDNNDNYKRIKIIELMENNFLEKYDGFLYFLGQHLFIKYNNIFHNINGQGKHILLSKDLFI